jgi:tetratricopeptide (TPR) repeat protein
MMHQVWAHNSAALIALRQDDLDKALACLEMARSLPGEKPEPQQALITWSYLGIAYLRRGEYGQAREAAGKALTIMEQIKASAYTHFEPMSAVVEIYLALWELPENISGITPEDCAAVVKDLCRSLQKGSIPLGQPAAALYQGWYDWLAGIQTNAVRRWAKGLAAAEKAGMPYELGLLHLESGRHLPVNDPRRRDHLDQALKIFAAMSANYQRDRTHALLDV